MNNCFETCEEPSCNAGAPCKKLKRRVRAGDAQPSNWIEIEPDMPIDFADDEPEPPSRLGIALVMVVMLAAWVGVYLMVM